jgi:predicted acylesterase/phospholipase RssA
MEMVETMTEKNVIVFQAGGQYFFWNMGVAEYMRENCDLSDITMVGASAGALVAVLLVCEVPAETTLTCALRLCEEFGVWDRWLRFFGIWGSMVAVWLDRLLPDNVAELCTDKVHIIVSQFLKPKKVVSRFTTKQEVIECLLTSIHIPFFMDCWPFRWFQGWWCYDGCIGNFTNKPYKIFDEKPHHNNNNYHFFYFQDDAGQQYSVFHCLPFHNKTNIAGFVDHGHHYARRWHDANRWLFKK